MCSVLTTRSELDAGQGSIPQDGPEVASALFFHELASAIGPVLQARHDVSEEAKVAVVVLGVGVRGVLVADDA